MADVTVDADWQDFVKSPAKYAIPERLSECLDGEISDSGCRLLLDSGRLEKRLSQRLASHYALEPIDLTLAADDRSVALLPGDKVRELALKCGAVLWASSLAGVIGKDDAGALHHRLGEDTVALALQNRDLSPPSRPLGDLGTIAERVRQDGWGCIYAWLAEMPPAVGARIRLKLRDAAMDSGNLDEAHVQLGPNIVRRIVGAIG